jgi:hypothetical protein
MTKMRNFDFEDGSTVLARQVLNSQHGGRFLKSAKPGRIRLPYRLGFKLRF